MAYGIVPPETDTITLSDGDTITIKTRLNTGELRAVLKRSRSESPSAAALDQLEYAYQLVVAHLVDWASPSGRWPPIKGEPESVRLALIDALDHDDYIAIKNAVVAHVHRIGEAREAAKKKTDGTPTSASISPLPSVADGVLTGSVP